MATPPPRAQPNESAIAPPPQAESESPPQTQSPPSPQSSDPNGTEISTPNSTSPPPPLSPSATSPLPSPNPPPPKAKAPTLPPSSPPPPPPPPSTSPPPKASPPPPLIASSPPPPSNKNSPPPPVESPPPPPVVSPPPPIVSPPPLSVPPPSPPTSPPPPAEPLEKPPPPPLISPPPPPSPLLVTPPAPSDPQPASPPPPPYVAPLPDIIKEIAPPPPRLPPPPPPSNPHSGEYPSIPSPYPPPYTNPMGNGGEGMGHAVKVATGVATGLILFSLIGLAIWCVCYLKRQKRKDARHNNVGYIVPSFYGSSEGSRSMANSPSEPSGFRNSRSLFTYQELEAFTDGFAPHNILGEGGFGPVYKGRLADGREVAVKQLKVGSGQGEREFRAEVEIISRVHHRHLVSLVGYCISDNQRMLVYDYVPNNDLHYHLHGEGRPVLDWATRSKVAAGAARGLAYLHEDCLPRIIHRDIKSSNILLDKNFEAQVADFGLARLASDTYTHVTTRVMGTFGYMAPEYARSGKLTEKSDVYSFGVVLLELITGRKPVDTSQPAGEESLVEWAHPLLTRALDSEKFDELVDPRLEKNYVEAEMFRMIEAAAACVRQSASKRPRMGQVMIALDSLGYAKDLSNGMTPGESKIYNSADQSAEIRLFNRMAFGSQDLDSELFSDGSRG